MEQVVGMDMDQQVNPYSQNSQTCEAYAAENGLVVVYPKDNELQLDIDSDASLAVFTELWPILLEVYPKATVTSKPSKSGKLGRQHITVTLGHDVYVSRIQRIALQAALGSDRKRELLSVKDWFEQDECPTLFYEKKPQQLLLTGETAQ